MSRNIALYPWFRFFQNLLFWQAIWFLFFQSELSAASAILLYAAYDIATTLLEVPSGWFSDRVGRRRTLILSSAAGAVATLAFVLGDGFAAYLAGQALLGASIAFASGTDSALLYESLAAEGREGEIEAQEIRAWRFSFSGLAVSAATGGAMALVSFDLAFAASGLAFVAALVIALRFTEPPHGGAAIPQGGEWLRLASLGGAFRKPVLVWLFSLGMLMYGYSHIPFVFGQPFILSALRGLGLEGDAPLVSGSVTTVMMLVSVAASLAAPRVRERLGLAATLLLAFGLQIALAAVLALSNALLVIAILFLRMVPNSLSDPFVIARIQPLLADESRATFLSLKSLAGRVLFASSLWLAAQATTDVGEMAYGEMRLVLAVYSAVGLLCLAALAVTAARAGVNPQRREFSSAQDADKTGSA